ncbi:Atxe2 family lasso peptide isopeptidase (plasmid) [Asticcacaulis sp. DW145]|uniref:Atxe2 family lasso peptide isopeptidase n=1 Tax=Asticcacaulis sp. DW145 TaxID=3095608 RepID=UPI00308A5F92|nr:Atxe2 family lasso peptide isopeptidase [Asticcacaulis sp. DW145]
MALKFAAVGVLLTAASGTLADECSNSVQMDKAAVESHRLLEPADLLSLNDIGQVQSGDPKEAILAVSPDGGSIAFQLRQADASTNSYCFRIAIVNLKTPGHALIVDSGGEYIQTSNSALGFAAHTPSGAPKVISPKWSPDGTSIAFLKKTEGSVQIWQAAADGSGSTQISRLGFDVESFDWSSDGSSLIASGRPGLLAAERAIEAESRQGFLYNARFKPLTTSAPLVREPIETKHYRILVADGAATELNLENDEAIRATQPLSGESTLTARGPAGQLAWTTKEEGAALSSPSWLTVKLADGQQHSCKSDVCGAITDMWWVGGKATLYYSRREGWANSLTGIYVWRVGQAAPRRVLQTTEVLVGCQPVARGLICAHETSTTPRKIIRLDLPSGRVTEIFDPNPIFKQLELGKVERLNWKTRDGIEVFGDLVLPPHHVPGQRHPLVIVQYRTRGFLRGGVGDEYPIQAFAARGFAVLSFDIPESVGVSRGAKTWEEVNRSNLKNWADRFSAQSALELGVALAVSKGVVDENRMGITGLSEGAAVAQFALIHSDLFKAAAISTCCQTPNKVTYLFGPTIAKWFHDMGYPSYLESNNGFWQEVALSLNADKIHTPLLIHASDREYLGALEGYTALEESSKPVEMYIFKDEYHLKWQPIHRLSIYERNIDWFDFWLRGVVDPDAKKIDQYARWQKMKDQQIKK